MDFREHYIENTQALNEDLFGVVGKMNRVLDKEHVIKKYVDPKMIAYAASVDEETFDSLYNELKEEADEYQRDVNSNPLLAVKHKPGTFNAAGHPLQKVGSLVGRGIEKAGEKVATAASGAKTKALAAYDAHKASQAHMKDVKAGAKQQYKATMQQGKQDAKQAGQVAAQNRTDQRKAELAAKGKKTESFIYEADEQPDVASQNQNANPEAPQQDVNNQAKGKKQPKKIKLGQIEIDPSTVMSVEIIYTKGSGEIYFVHAIDEHERDIYIVAANKYGIAATLKYTKKKFESAIVNKTFGTRKRRGGRSGGDKGMTYVGYQTKQLAGKKDALDLAFALSPKQLATAISKAGKSSESNYAFKVTKGYNHLFGDGRFFTNLHKSSKGVPWGDVAVYINEDETVTVFTSGELADKKPMAVIDALFGKDSQKYFIKAMAKTQTKSTLKFDEPDWKFHENSKNGEDGAEKDGAEKETKEGGSSKKKSNTTTKKLKDFSATFMKTPKGDLNIIVPSTRLGDFGIKLTEVKKVNNPDYVFSLAKSPIPWVFKTKVPYSTDLNKLNDVFDEKAAEGKESEKVAYDLMGRIVNRLSSKEVTPVDYEYENTPVAGFDLVAVLTNESFADFRKRLLIEMENGDE